MLEMLDVAIGFAVVMLGISLIITSLTQATVALLGLRGMQLWIGLKWLFKEAVPTLTLEQAKELSRKVVSHPLISDTSMKAGMPLWGRASAIKREELIPVLENVEKNLPAGFKQALLSDDEKKRIEQWFDTFMARVSQWFTMYTRVITVVFAAAIALYLQLDAGQLLQRLQNDGATRTAAAAVAGPLMTEAKDLLGKTDAASADQLTKSIETAKKISTQLASTASLLEKDGKTPSEQPATSGADGIMEHLPGIAATVILLSLGAPFWFNVLKQATSLRSVVAQQIGPTDQPAGGAVRGMVAIPPPPGPPAPTRLPSLP